MIRTSRWTSALAAVMCALALSACGGSDGDSGDDGATPPTPSQPVATLQSPKLVAQSMGAVPLNGATYDVAAMMLMPGLTSVESIGTEDHWRITLDRASKTYAIKVIANESKIPDLQGTYTSVQNGDIETISFDNARGQLKISDAYKTITGIAHGAQIIGTGYAPTAVAPLDGNYNFVNLLWTDTFKIRQYSAGQASIKNGTLLLCPGSTVQVDGSCTDGVKSQKWNVALNNGVLHVTDQSASNTPVSTAHLIASDVGKSMVIAGGIGSLYLVQATNTGSNVVNGNWSCNGETLSTRRVDINAPSLTYNGRTTNVLLNALYDTRENKPYTFPGFVGAPANTPERLPVLLLPLTSKMAVGTIGEAMLTGGLFNWCTR